MTKTKKKKDSIPIVNLRNIQSTMRNSILLLIFCKFSLRVNESYSSPKKINSECCKLKDKWFVDIADYTKRKIIKFKF